MHNCGVLVLILYDSVCVCACTGDVDLFGQCND